MTEYLKGLALAVIATIALAFASGACGYNMIGYDPQSYVIVGGIFGFMVGALAGLPALFCPRCRSYLARLSAGALAAVFIWLFECVCLAGTNGGMTWAHAEHVAGIGGLIGAAMWLASWRSKH